MVELQEKLLEYVMKIYIYIYRQEDEEKLNYMTIFVHVNF
jgi:hypothetical protein